MEIFKFQCDVTGTRILLYNENRKTHAQVEGDIAQTIKAALGLTAMSKCYTYAMVDNHGQIHIGENADEQDW